MSMFQRVSQFDILIIIIWNHCVGAKKADLVALLLKNEELPVMDADTAEAENSNDVSDEIEKISAEDDITKVDEEDEDETKVRKFSLH